MSNVGGVSPSGTGRLSRSTSARSASACAARTVATWPATSARSEDSVASFSAAFAWPEACNHSGRNGSGASS